MTHEIAMTVDLAARAEALRQEIAQLEALVIRVTGALAR